MRMWMINPKLLCDQHLRGEHYEIHKFRHVFVKHHSIKKRILYRQIEPINMEKRHNELVEEMLRRGFNHKSPYTLPDLNHLTDTELNCKVILKNSLDLLITRCPDCRKRILTKEKNL